MNYREILIFGGKGQIGRALRKIVHEDSIFLDRSHCDIANKYQLLDILDKYKPKIIINAAAYTEVDAAENDYYNAAVINSDVPMILANYIARIEDSIYIHYSTDYVFNGTSPNYLPYKEYENPKITKNMGVYAKTKVDGEQNIKYIYDLHNNPNSKYYILRTSWVYGDGDNFVRKMLSLAMDKPELMVIADQIGVPTSADWVSKVTIEFLQHTPESGVYHVVPYGHTSWHGYATTIIDISLDLGFAIKAKKIKPIFSHEFKQVAMRPHYSVLDNTKLIEFQEKNGLDLPKNWRDYLYDHIINLESAKLIYKP